MSWARTEEEYDAEAVGNIVWHCPWSLSSLTCDNKNKDQQT